MARGAADSHARIDPRPLPKNQEPIPAETSTSPSPWPLAQKPNSTIQTPSHNHQQHPQLFKHTPSIPDCHDHLELAASSPPPADIPKGRSLAPNSPKLRAHHRKAAANSARPSQAPTVASSVAATSTPVSSDELGRGPLRASPQVSNTSHSFLAFRACFLDSRI